MEYQPRHRQYPKRCREKGHAWRQRVWGVLGADVCSRKGCDATRINPDAEPPWITTPGELARLNERN